MLSPKKVKYRKMQRGRIKGVASNGNEVSFGEFGIQALDSGMITARQIEASRIAIARTVKRGGKIWIRIFPDYPYTKKPAETRMGKGKGSPEFWVSKIKPGKVLFEITGVEESLARKALTRAMYKLPLKTRIVKRSY